MTQPTTPVSHYDWDHDETVDAYEVFSARHDRYLQANRALVENAHLEAGSNILDFAAGMGGTTKCLLAEIDQESRIVCIEPSDKMRDRGQAQIRDTRVSWQSELPDVDSLPAAYGYYDRIVCGAAIWQIFPLQKVIQQLRRLLKPGGALCFNIPALYLGEADAVGEGDDSNLGALPALLQQRARLLIPALAHQAATFTQVADPLAVKSIDKMLRSQGLSPVHWHYNYRLTQAAYKDWLKIPVISNGFFPGIASNIRNQIIEEAFQQVDASAWRWECWRGWTAWDSRR
jgi:SAM-dependent methyltransferase